MHDNFADIIPYKSPLHLLCSHRTRYVASFSPQNVAICRSIPPHASTYVYNTQDSTRHRTSPQRNASGMNERCVRAGAADRSVHGFYCMLTTLPCTECDPRCTTCNVNHAGKCDGQSYCASNTFYDGNSMTCKCKSTAAAVT